jgi:hypothetical protein
MAVQFNINIRKRRISEVFAVAAMIVLAIDISDTFIGQDGYGFLQLTNQQRGLLIGIPSMILFFISFGIGYSQKSRCTTLLLLVGGIVELALQANSSILWVVIIAINRTDTFVHSFNWNKLCHNRIGDI